MDLEVVEADRHLLGSPNRIGLQPKLDPVVAATTTAAV